MRMAAATIAPSQFDVCRSVESLARLLSIDADELARIAERAPLSYREKQIPKRSGGTRTIHPPNYRLCGAQRRFLHAMQNRVRFPRWVMGSVRGRSVLDHAKVHVGRAMVATFDVGSFFPQTREPTIRLVLERLGLADEALELTVKLLIHEGGLPQGSPASPLIANLALDDADRRIVAIARRHCLNYSRYVDDMALSGDVKLQGYAGTVRDAVEALGYEIAEDKICFMPKSHRQVVTRIIVNDALLPTPEFVDELEDTIWACRQLGACVVAAAEGKAARELKSQLNGRIAYLKRVNSKRGLALQTQMYDIAWREAPPVEDLA